MYHRLMTWSFLNESFTSFQIISYIIDISDTHIDANIIQHIYVIACKIETDEYIRELHSKITLWELGIQ